MSTFRPYSLQCSCGQTFRAELAVAVNAVRMPQLRDAIVDGRFHRMNCPFCGRDFTVEKQFTYIDLMRKMIIHVHPPRESFRWHQASVALNQALGAVDAHGVMAPDVTRRVVFGIGELRDKLVAQDSGFDDRHVELAKVLAIHEHPILLRIPRLRFFLSKADNRHLEFFAGYDHAQKSFKVSLPRFAFDRLTDSATAENWVGEAHNTSIFDAPDDHWVSVRRWSPSNAVLNTLHDNANKVRNGEAIDLDSDPFKLMLANLPRGAQLITSAKTDLRDLEKYAKSKGRADIEKALFLVRFGNVQLDDEWGADRQTGDIDTLWDLLKDLPDTDVEGNTKIHEIFLKPGDGGGLYNPSSDDIEVTTDPTDTNDFQNVIRHEIGHAVQEKLDTEQDNLVTKFLAARFGWQTFPGTRAGAQAWVNLMDGWGSVAVQDRDRIANMLVQGLGPGSSWNPPPPTNPPANDAWWKPDFGPRLAVAGTLPNWYANNNQWYRKNGRAYFLNYWYQQFMVVNEAILDFIDKKMPWNYAAMSPSEFFAELYALYYRLDAPLRDNIAAEDRQWFDAHVGLPRQNAPAQPPPAFPPSVG
jgi:hypothetical protein